MIGTVSIVRNRLETSECLTPDGIVGIGTDRQLVAQITGVVLNACRHRGDRHRPHPILHQIQGLRAPDSWTWPTSVGSTRGEGRFAGDKPP